MSTADELLDKARASLRETAESLGELVIEEPLDWDAYTPEDRATIRQTLHTVNELREHLRDI